MQRRTLLALLIGLLLFESGAMLASITPSGAWWAGFLVFLPLGLGLLVWLRLQWAAMACVLYGTVGLAIDLSTLVHILTKDPDGSTPLFVSLVSGTLNFLLILVGGRSFLEPALERQPQESRPPNRRSPFSDGAV